MSISGLLKVGIAVESNGWALPTDTGVAPTHLLPVTSVTVTNPFEQILDEAKRGVRTSPFAAYQGVGSVEMTLEGPFYPEVCGFFLALMMGSAGSPSGSAPYVHSITMTNAAPTSSTQRSLSVQVEDAVSKDRYIGMVVTSLTLRFSAAEGMLTYSANLVGQQRLTNQSAMSTSGEWLSPGTVVQPFLGWHAQVTQGGANARVVESEITFERESYIRYSANQSQKPADIQVGDLTLTARATLDYYQSSDVDLYTDKTQSAFIWDFDFTPDGAAYAKNLTITCSKMDYGEGPVEIDRSGVNMLLTWSMRAIANTTDGSAAAPAPCQIALSNDYGSAYLS
jgi:hypothetical protein